MYGKLKEYIAIERQMRYFIRCIVVRVLVLYNAYDTFGCDINL